MPVKVFVDLDHTLIENPFAGAVLPAVAATLGTSAGQSNTDVLAQLLGEARARSLATFGPIRQLDWQEIVEVVASRIGSTTIPDVEALVSRFSSPPDSFAYPGARDALRGIRGAGWSPIASSKGLWRFQRHPLEALGLLELFDAFAMPDLVGASKTEAAFYARFVAPGDRVLTVGDNPYEDVCVPRQLGFLTILKRFDHSNHAIAAQLIDGPRDDVGAHATIDHLADLVPTIRRLLGPEGAAG